MTDGLMWKRPWRRRTTAPPQWRSTRDMLESSLGQRVASKSIERWERKVTQIVCLILNHRLRWKPPFNARQSDESWSLPLKKDQSSVILGFLTKRGLLPWVVTTLIFSAICFSLLCFDRRRSLFCGTYSNGKYEAIKYGTEELVRRLRKEDRLLVEVVITTQSI